MSFSGGWKILKKFDVLHRADSQGPRITRGEILLCPEGRQYAVSYWTDESGRLLNVTSTPLEEARK
jgi:hypothetical protein